MAFERLLLQAGFSETLSSRCLSQASFYRRGPNNDVHRTVYFFMRGSPIQFKVTAIMLVCWDSGELRAFEPVESEKKKLKVEYIQLSLPSVSSMAPTLLWTKQAWSLMRMTKITMNREHCMMLITIVKRDDL